MTPAVLAATSSSKSKKKKPLEEFAALGEAEETTHQAELNYVSIKKKADVQLKLKTMEAKVQLEGIKAKDKSESCSSKERLKMRVMELKQERKMMRLHLMSSQGVMTQPAGFSMPGMLPPMPSGHASTMSSYDTPYGTPTPGPSFSREFNGMRSGNDNESGGPPFGTYLPQPQGFLPPLA